MKFDAFRKKRFPHMKDHGPLYEVARICYEAGAGGYRYYVGPEESTTTLTLPPIRRPKK